MLTHNPSNPGLIVKKFCLEPLEITITDVAKALDVSRNSLSRIIYGKAGIGPEMAVRYSNAFNASAESWINHQS